MNFKPGDRVVFDLEKRINVIDGIEDYLVCRNINPFGVYTVKILSDTVMSLRELDEAFMFERFKKVSTWKIKFIKEVKCV